MTERRSIVVTHRIGYKYWLLGSLMAVGLSSFILGKWWGQAELADVINERQQLTSKVSELVASLDFKSTELEMVRLNATVDSVALENTRQEMIVLQKNINRNEEQLGLYKELLGDSNQPTGLSITAFDLTPLDKGRFAYRWVARQKTSKMQTSEIVADISIIGLEGNQVSTVLLSDLDDEIEKMLTSYGGYPEVVEKTVKYYIDKTGEWTLQGEDKYCQDAKLVAETLLKK